MYFKLEILIHSPHLCMRNADCADVQIISFLESPPRPDLARPMTTRHNHILSGPTLKMVSSYQVLICHHPPIHCLQLLLPTICEERNFK